MTENVIEWLTGQDIICLTLSQKKYVWKARKLANKYPDKVTIDVENQDGSIVVHMPLSFLRFQPPGEITEEQREANIKRLEPYYFKKQGQ